jgi:superfamily I DNA and/or RNA helicase
MEFQKKMKDKEIGIISFYEDQRRRLRDAIQSDPVLKDIRIRLRTVDKFQGMEKDIIIVSTVRSIKKGDAEGQSYHGSIGFAREFRRINVAFSRARRMLIIVGNEEHFRKSEEYYANIIDIIARKRGRFDSNQIEGILK